MFVSVGMLGFLAVWKAKEAVTEKVESHLTDKANDIARIIDGKLTQWFQFMEGIARMPILASSEISMREKLGILAQEAKFDADIQYLLIIDKKGNLYLPDGSVRDLKYLSWLAQAGEGNYISEPFDSKIFNKLMIAVTTPVYDEAKNVVANLVALTDGLMLCKEIENIKVGESGACYIIASSGTTLADGDHSLVTNFANTMEAAKKDATLKELADFERLAIDAPISSVGFWNYEGVRNISSFAKIKITSWIVIIQAPVSEFMGTIQTLQKLMLALGLLILLVSLTVVYLVASAFVKPIAHTVQALKDIAQGEGDLTVRLKTAGNDEITDLALYFNETIKKIASAIQAVEENAHIMEGIGSELASNMTETASSVTEISSNIEGVKGQAMSQAASVAQTASTIEEIGRTIRALNSSIESQASSVAMSSSSIEQMVANIASIASTLAKSDELIGNLRSATQDGKDTLATSNSMTVKIAEESGSLMEASSVIQHIASQTNLLAMNAAIEAAHAGEAGKGFAVVADEIRKLAEESASQGKTITATLKSLSGEIEGLSSSSKVVETKFNAIFSLAEQVRDMSARLTEAMREQEHGSREVLTAIKDINQVTSEVQQGSEEMLKGSEGVAGEMEKLSALARIITDSMNEMAAGAAQIRGAVNEVAELTQKNERSIEALAEEVGRFKV